MVSIKVITATITEYLKTAETYAFKTQTHSNQEHFNWINGKMKQEKGPE